MGIGRAITSAVLVLSLVCAVNAQAQDTVQSDFMAACAKGIMDADPIWSEQQLAQMCDCRFDLLDENFSRDDIAGLTYAINNVARFEVSEAMTAANTEYVGVCLNKLSEGR